MQIARVVGTTISTVKDPRVRGRKLLLCQPTDVTGKEVLGRSFAAVDVVDAGTGDLVLVCHGSAARQTPQTKDAPVDSVVMAVLDSMELDGATVFRKE
ncbi:MAG: EutN/CcmL family microcompartment protein [Chloroflexi bacterium]|nr:EutN/CcmL family microcompartment protein [Chloroflexota bacterium]